MYVRYNGPDAADETYKLEDDGTTYGDPPLVRLDLNRFKIIVDAKDESLLDKVFQVFVTQHIYTNRAV